MLVTVTRHFLWPSLFLYSPVTLSLPKPLSSFPGLSVKPQEGTALLFFPATYPHGLVDERTLHSAEPLDTHTHTDLLHTLHHAFQFPVV
jgi:hypothetical protein